MQRFLFLDLDDTLFQTRRKCPSDEDLLPVGYARDGTPLSFMTPRQALLFDWLAETMTMIPTTARNLDAFRRVKLPFSDWAILNFGGVVLDANGQLHAPWHERMMAWTAETSPVLRDAQARLDDWIQTLGWEINCRLISDFELDLYVVLKHRDGNQQRLEELAARAREAWVDAPLKVQLNDNNLTLVPNYLNKAAAVAHVLEHRVRGHGEHICFGMGDSLSDLGFLGLCDFSLIPRRSQIFDAVEHLA